MFITYVVEVKCLVRLSSVVKFQNLLLEDCSQSILTKSTSLLESLRIELISSSSNPYQRLKAIEYKTMEKA